MGGSTAGTTGGSAARDGSGVGRRNQAVGSYGERVAAEHLHQAGYEVVERNWRCGLGELDIVARGPDVLVFCEVKTRTSTRFGSPIEAVTRVKAARLRSLALAWLSAHDEHAARIRIDVIGVQVGTGAATVQHLQGVA